LFTGANGINPRVAIGAIFIKHMCDLSDREVVQQIQENVYMQYFIGYSGFSSEPVFDPSLFVDLRKRFGANQINEINEAIMGLVREEKKDNNEESPPDNNMPGVESSELKPKETIYDSDKELINDSPQAAVQENSVKVRENKGDLIVDATACPQDISYPTDLNLLNDAREQSEIIIDILCAQIRVTDEEILRPRTYREIARKAYLKVAQKKHKTKKEIRHALRKQLNYLSRNIKCIQQLLKDLGTIPLKHKEYKYLLVIQTLYDQQKLMYDHKTHSVEHRIVSIHQPHVRHIVR